MSLSLQACVPKLITAGPGQGNGDVSGQIQPGGNNGSTSGGSGSGTGSGGAETFVPASGDVTVSGSTDWLDDEVECDAEGYCSRWVDI